MSTELFAEIQDFAEFSGWSMEYGEMVATFYTNNRKELFFVKHEQLTAAIRSYPERDSLTVEASRTPTPMTRTVPKIGSAPFRKSVRAVLFPYIHRGKVYEPFTLDQAVDAVLSQMTEQWNAARHADMEPMFLDAVRYAVRHQLSSSIWNAHGMKAFHAVHMDDGFKWVHFLGLNADMLKRLIADIDQAIVGYRERRKVYIAFLEALPTGGYVNDVYGEVSERLGWELLP